MTISGKNTRKNRRGTSIDNKRAAEEAFRLARRAATPRIVDDNEQTLLAEVAYVQKNLTQAEGKVKGNSSKAAIHDKRSYSAITNTVNYHIYAYIYDLDTVIGKKKPTEEDGEEFVEMYRSGVLIRCEPQDPDLIKKQGLPKVNEKIWIRCNPLDSKKEGIYIGRYNKGDFTSVLTTTKKVRRSLSILTGGKPLTPGSNLHGLTSDMPQTEKVGDVQFSARQPSAWLKTCATENGWVANLTTTQYAPPEYREIPNPTNTPGLGGKIPFYSERNFVNTAVAAGANKQNRLFSIVYQDGVPSIRALWRDYINISKSSIHYYIDARSKVHEFVDPSKKANHCSNQSCPSNNDLSIGIGYCHHALSFNYLYSGKDINNSLKAEYRFLLQNGYMLIGAPKYTGIPSPQTVYGASSTNASYFDSYIIGSKEVLETGWKLTQCLAKKYNIPIGETIPQLKMVHMNGLPGNLGTTNIDIGSINSVPYFYNLERDLKGYGKMLCGHEGMVRYPGIRSMSSATTGQYDAGKVPEFYALCRISGYNPQDAYYATLGSMILPGITKGANLGSSEYIINSDDFTELFGDFYTKNSAVPHPSNATARTALLQYGKKVYTIAEFYRSLILYKDAHAGNVADKFKPGLIAAATLDVDENNPWQEIALSLAEETKPCLEIYDTLRIKIADQMKLSDLSLTNEKLNDYESDLGLYVTKLALDLFIYVSKESDNNSIEDCLDDDEETYESFAKSFKDKYKFDIKTVVNI